MNWLTPAEVADELGIDVGKVLQWIRSGELPAVDVTERRGKRPRWRIARGELDKFLRGRQSRPTPEPSAPKPRRRAPAAAGEVIQFV